MKLYIHMDEDEIRENIAYPLICTMRESSVWSTGKRRRRWVAEFTEQEREASSRLFSQAHTWYLTKGVPNEGVKMSFKTLALWKKIEAFCASL